MSGITTVTSDLSSEKPMALGTPIRLCKKQNGLLCVYRVANHLFVIMSRTIHPVYKKIEPSIELLFSGDEIMLLVDGR